MNNYNVSLPAVEMSRQVAALINQNNRLYIKHNAASILYSRAQYFVQSVGDKVVGCSAIIQEEPKLTKQFHLCVHPDFRRKGLARKLKQTALDHVQTPYVYVTIRDDNIASLNLNYSFGFVFVKKVWTRGHYVITLGRKTKQEVI